MPGSTLKVFLALIDSLAQIANSDALFFARLSFIHSNACLECLGRKSDTNNMPGFLELATLFLLKNPPVEGSHAPINM